MLVADRSYQDEGCEAFSNAFLGIDYQTEGVNPHRTLRAGPLFENPTQGFTLHQTKSNHVTLWSELRKALAHIPNTLKGEGGVSF